MIELYEHQKQAIEKLKTGSILYGGVGSGKSRTALAYYKNVEYPKSLYIITTARKRDTKEWENEYSIFDVEDVIVDSWNNIKKYRKVSGAFFIFDEQRVIGSGIWVKSFLEITRKNNWILLTATPGDTWMDYIPVFVANGFYKNRTEFIQRHIIYSRFSKYPKVDRYIEVRRLIKLKEQIMVNMHFEKATVLHEKTVLCNYNRELYTTAFVKRWNMYMNCPIKDAGELCYILRKIVNSDPDKLTKLLDIFNKHSKIIIFYNFNFELDILIQFGVSANITTAQWNGHKHEQIPNTDSWLYLVQYAAGAEGWNCIETDTIVFYSQNYSYKAMIQAAGRIDRLNTPFTDLYYYIIRSNSSIDFAINKALKDKKNFNENHFYNVNGLA